MKKAVFPGSFDPLTNGHLDIIQRASEIFDEVVVAVGINTNKQGLFTPSERLELVEEAVADLPNVQVGQVGGLTVDYMNEIGAKYLVRGLRNAKDFEYERDIAEVNSVLAGVETVLLLAKPENQNVSSSMVKEIAKFGADKLDAFVPAVVVTALQKHFQ
ncbi:pantetheine-phosphate adenylyltransferase [Fructobacillus evanidus]|uniref:Phosphopantetheine adenylyltransferase n=1 Tax=Fructobacillus evanidus TaxID=3064281 RepID=A0ABN9YP53_9LACO|nr:Phosphopantetheine adenylyltransferase (CoaD) [Fructobacillus sp. LMG 32999]CAK1230357.1 Phosphopantetheine adenylyltransferase (CoaD) [Fructobacillus sp. LMG 32999]CAK1234322.1 Phosphopantetheine adenylyltransferase (CoaD) [Fructobacillus sp. LMG 32999]CAK1236252.1 Phosphopantetheine adenylyltransferase (CoaD) [Fructobacillus sp. LMG 32999]CAK1238323.1 Phosphopantetheine adenylyltransferase (CoaD) [Fructobacillus sp. LMG 32999]